MLSRKHGANEEALLSEPATRAHATCSKEAFFRDLHAVKHSV